MWDDRQVIEDEESELIELFEGNHLGGNSDREASNTVLGYATAADCMSSYIGMYWRILCSLYFGYFFSQLRISFLKNCHHLKQVV